MSEIESVCFPDQIYDDPRSALYIFFLDKLFYEGMFLYADHEVKEAFQNARLTGLSEEEIKYVEDAAVIAYINLRNSIPDEISRLSLVTTAC